MREVEIITFIASDIEHSIEDGYCIKMMCTSVNNDVLHGEPEKTRFGIQNLAPNADYYLKPGRKYRLVVQEIQED